MRAPGWRTRQSSSAIGVLIALLAFAGASRAGAQQARRGRPSTTPTTTTTTTSGGQIAPAAYTEAQVQTIAEPAPGSGAPGYPAALAQARVEGRVVAEFVVDTTGLVEVDSFHAVESTNPVFVDAVRAALSTLRYRPATIDGKPVRQIVQQPFVFSLDQ
jgi:TonB family protein